MKSRVNIERVHSWARLNVWRRALRAALARLRAFGPAGAGAASAAGGRGGAVGLAAADALLGGLRLRFGVGEAETTRRREGLLIRREELQQLELFQCRESRRRRPTTVAPQAGGQRKTRMHCSLFQTSP